MTSLLLARLVCLMVWCRLVGRDSHGMYSSIVFFCFSCPFCCCGVVCCSSCQVVCFFLSKSVCWLGWCGLHQLQFWMRSRCVGSVLE